MGVKSRNVYSVTGFGCPNIHLVEMRSTLCTMYWEPRHIGVCTVHEVSGRCWSISAVSLSRFLSFEIHSEVSELLMEPELPEAWLYYLVNLESSKATNWPVLCIEHIVCSWQPSGNRQVDTVLHHQCISVMAVKYQLCIDSDVCRGQAGWAASAAKQSVSTAFADFNTKKTCCG